MPKEQKAEIVAIPAIEIGKSTLTIIGDSALICHNWSSKAKKEMLDKQMKKAKQAREAKDPERDYLESLYTVPGKEGFYFPSVAIKAAAVDACSHIDGMTKVLARGAFHIIGDMVKINGEPRPREDMVRVGMGTADIRYRGEFPEWSITFDVRYNKRSVSLDQIVNMINVGGFAIGIGEWRPQRDGSFGMFHVAEGGE